MILIDASVWIDHFRRPIERIHEVVERKDAYVHPLLIGELAMGSLRDRRETLRSFARMPTIAQATNAEVLAFVEWQQLFGAGLGFIDAHLLTAVRFTDGCRLWTRDRRLHAQAERLGVAFAA